ncbi:MAG: flippase-like domain-containing protein [candidate division KSB1 bacterium]|nr:flippase-like domain-containing protein [candidate division KSB1 bacterium]MDZ7302149.1 flippase-like domain-containing protein [candidate division KSB1 bacterium]MDZ7311259.1 flippase-like domain-containing protein [candidate division KSB1 bacterium]
MRLFIILSLGLLISVAYSAFTVDSSALSAFNQFPMICVVALTGMVVLPWLTDTIRLQVWLRFLGKRERFSEVFRATLASEMATALVPAAIGGNGAKLGWLITRGIAPGVAGSVMLLAALEDAVFFALALPVALLLSAKTREGFSLDKIWSLFRERGLTGIRGLSLFILGIAAVWLAGWITWQMLPAVLKMRLTGFGKKIKQQVGLAKQTFRMMIARGRWRFLVTVSLSGLHWACRFSMLTVLLIGLHQYVDPFNFFASQWLVFMLTKLAPSPGGTGGAELAFLALYRSFLPENMLGLLVGAWRVLTFTLPVGLATLLFLALVRKGAFIELKSMRLKKAIEPA